MKKLLFAFLIVVAVTAELLAAQPVWNNGYVILADGRKLEGQVNYNWKAEVVQVKMPNGLVRAFSAGHAATFVYYDTTQQLLRFFSSVNLPDSRQVLKPIFMEEVTTGSLSVYRRLRHTREFIKLLRPSIYGDDTELIKEIDNFTYLVINTEGDVVDLNAFNQTLWPAMIAYQNELSQYIRSREMDASSTLSRLLIINQYNYLLAQKTQAVQTVSGE
ncbi:hypothetical protein [Fibrivirga algicola]|uniref:DUF4369 domain-containing protein n=1 Tax=Fibrivirga algicola TaxID=2950420 RepID=A0ABX0QM36_9BACT|nr:hypothetical protein [Fibrivirga algicola]ARK11297.1 hypothetical protein A6C57_13765 [Fibrella sp. ES10-3-2-2]NID13171.1 hypothetical protein [Fibrivirga algicola]